jgi:hypothetical protein
VELSWKRTKELASEASFHKSHVSVKECQDEGAIRIETPIISSVRTNLRVLMIAEIQAGRSGLSER